MRSESFLLIHKLIKVSFRSFTLPLGSSLNINVR